MANFAQLIAVFEDSRRWVALPDNDFCYSSWIDTDHALVEIDGILNRLRDGEMPSVMGVLFAPTGPMQELAMSSGWGDEFIEIANRYDAAVAASADPPRAFLAALEACGCFSSPLSMTDAENLGVDRRFAEVSLATCPVCGQAWLRYFYEDESVSRSGRWYLGAVSSGPDLSPDSARTTFEGMDWYFYGGSYYEGQVGKTSGPLT